MGRFEEKLRGPLHGLRLWADWERLQHHLPGRSELGWYAYAAGTELPDHPHAPAALETLLAEIDRLLRHDHDEAYPGIVYVDDRDAPSLVRIHDPSQPVSCPAAGRPPALVAGTAYASDADLIHDHLPVTST